MDTDVRHLSPRAMALRTSWRTLRRTEQAIARLRKAHALTGHRDWAEARRARTRLLIEYGGLLVKAGLPDRVDDDRATLLGALLMIRDQLDGFGDDRPADLKTRWRRRGLRTFDADAAARAETRRHGRDRVEEPMPPK